MPTAAPSSRTAARAKELLVQATIMAVALWGIAVFDASSASTRGRLSRRPTGTDFINFYTLAHIGAESRYDALASFDAFHAEQLRLLPDSAQTLYPPVYPPQVALLLSPLARLGYWPAYLSWIGASVLAYLATVRLMTRHCAQLRVWPVQVTAVAIANPALWFVALHGQVSVVALLAVGAAWWALQERRVWIAGIALGLLGFKPSLFVPALAFCLVAREWRLAGGALLGAVGQFVVALPWVGPSAIEQYVVTMAALLRTPDLVASNPPLMHSLRTFWAALLPSWLATAAYAVAAGAVLAFAARAWRRLPGALDRIGVLSLAMVLTSPHLFVYDLLILTPLLLASAERVLTASASLLRRLTYVCFFAPIWGIPVAVAGLQASTVLLASWLVVFAETAARASRTSDPASGRDELAPAR